MNVWATNLTAIISTSVGAVVTAYETAKGTYTVQEYNSETHKMEEVEKPMPFNGWEDDIVVEETEEELNDATKLANRKVRREQINELGG